MNKGEYKVETMRGSGPGGQHKNKTDSAVRITHLATGLSAFADCRSQKHSKRAVMKALEHKLANRRLEASAAGKKAKRDEAIKPQMHIRTYDYKSGLAIDHRSGKKAPLKQVMGKGRIDLLR